MNLLDFTYWTSLNESQKSYYVFEIPDRALTEINVECIRILTELFDEHSDLFSYDISPTPGRIESRGDITIAFKSEKDELLSSIYGDTTDFELNLVLPGNSGYTNGEWKEIRPYELERYLKNSSFQSTSKKSSQSYEVTLAIQPSELENKIATVAMRINGMYKSPEKPTRVDFAKAQDHAIVSNLGTRSDSITDALASKINEYIRYESVIALLHKLIKSTSTPNLDEIRTSFKTRLAEIKSLDPEKEDDFKEILSFQKELLSKASTQKIENPVTTDSLIEVFRIVLNKINNVQDISKELKKITD